MPPPATDLRRPTWLHQLPAKVKISVTFALVIATALLPPKAHLSYLGPAAAVLLLWVLCRMPLFYALRRLLLAEVFLVGIALLSLFSHSAAPVFFAAFLKSNICVSAMIFLTWTTPFTEILQLLRQVRIPSAMLTTLALMYRYLPVLGEETKRMERARASRTFSRKRLILWRNLTEIIGQLFIRSTERAERIYLAMCARGWR